MSGRGTEQDFTRAVMGRLGYMRVDPRVARRRAWRRRLLRGGATCGLIALVGLGVHLQLRGQASRQAEVMTIPTAIQHDVNRSQTQFRGVVNRLRTILPPAPPPVRESLPQPAERSGMGPTDDPGWRVEIESRTTTQAPGQARDDEPARSATRSGPEPGA